MKQIIILESDQGYILKKGKGHFEVYKNTITHAVREGIFHYSDNEGKALKLAQQRLSNLK